VQRILTSKEENVTRTENLQAWPEPVK